MAESVVSAVLPMLIEKLASEASKNIVRYKGIDAEIEKCQDSLKLIQDVLVDASEKEITNQAVKRWLNDLQHLAYDIDDVLDGWATEAMHREFTHSKVRKLIPSCFTNFSPRLKVHDKLDSINAKLDRLLKQKNDFGLSVGGETRPRNDNRRNQSSVVDPSRIFGRQAAKEALVQQLLRDEPSSDQNYSIVPIVGMGGVGKTTMARLLYNEEKVKDHFELRAWVCVSDEFNSFRISKEILEAIANVKEEVTNFDKLQVALKDHLTHKRFLLVLDDVWTESYEDWKTLVGPFHVCAPGSKIIITTRKDPLLKRLRYGDLNPLLGLSHDDALSLFALHALGVNNFNAHKSLKPYGEAIVKKCDGLPLALIALGTSLGTKEDEDSWKRVLESDIWKVEGEIIPALRLSYQELSAPLKRLFAYCSLFPKDFLFDKKDLVLLWMAEGFLHQATPNDSTEESLGQEFFDELLSRSFFQQAPNNESLFVMHDIMNDLATSVATEFFLRLDNESEKNIKNEMLEKYRHMSFQREEFVAYKKFEAFERAKSLRTFLAIYVGEVKFLQSFYLSNKILTDLLPKLPLLRVLYLSGFCITEVPESIDTLSHLRYLNLSGSSITHLPEKVCNLYNLQTLILSGCGKLTKLPNGFLRLKNLRHLDVRGTSLLFRMLLGISELKTLQFYLSKIVIESESGNELAEVKDFKNLCDEISIVGLEKVQNANYAREANFSHKRLSELELVWSDELNDSRNQMLEKEVLNELKPCADNLTQLKVRSYGGLEFPNWIGDPLFRHLKHVLIRSCWRCTSLPPLEQLPSLEILRLGNMRELKKWLGVVFPRLQKLEIEDCPNLVEVKLEALPSLNTLEIRRCDSGVLTSLVQVAPVLTKLEIRGILGLNGVVWRGVIGYLGAVEELSINVCHEIKYLVESDALASKILVNLRKLYVYECDNLVSLGETEESKILTSLRILKVKYCKNMERCICPDGVEELSVWNCWSITVVSFPKGGQEKLRSLEIHGCRKLLEREWGGQNMNNRSSMPMLEYVSLDNFPNLKSIIDLNCLVHLTELKIDDCESLESFPDNLKSLKKLEISKCPKLDVSFVRDNLTSLKELTIYNCPSMDAHFSGWVWPPSLNYLRLGMLKKPFLEWGPQYFPTSLVGLCLDGDGEDGVSNCSQLSHLLPSSLTSLYIIEFEKLESFTTGGLHHLHRLSFYGCPNLEKLSLSQQLTSLQRLDFANCPNLKQLSLPQQLTSLQHLSFYSCPNMMELPELQLPSLLSLYIGYNCPNLKERYSKNGSYWPLISHIPCIDIL